MVPCNGLVFHAMYFCLLPSVLVMSSGSTMTLTKMKGLLKMNVECLSKLWKSESHTFVRTIMLSKQCSFHLCVLLSIYIGVRISFAHMHFINLNMTYINICKHELNWSV